MQRLPLFLILGVAATALAGPASLAQTTPEAAAPADAASAVPAITVSEVGTRVLRDRVVGSGFVTPVEEVVVQPLIEGQPIETLEADAGDMVAEGQILARLSSSTLTLRESQFAAQRASALAAIAQAEAQQVEARAASDEAARVNERTQQLRAQGSSSIAAADAARAAAASAAARVQVAVQGLEAARAQLALVDAQIDDLALQLARTEVTAPVAGRVVERNARIGGIATAAGDPMFVIIRDNALELHAEMAERFMARLAPGQPVLMRAIGQPEPLGGSVRLVEPSINQTTRLGEVRIALDRSDMVRPGMFLDAEILVAEREALAVPVSAVATEGDGPGVMLVRDGVVARVPVALGIRDGGFVEITQGIAAGDLVVTRAAAFVRDGDRINPVPDATGTN